MDIRRGIPKPKDAENLRGLYCWAGPGTVRMLKLKYFHPLMNEDSIMSSYDYDVLAKLKEKFGLTDVWATYSWGFSPQTEAVDYNFLAERVDNFHKLGIRVHAYIQGPNLVYDEFPNRDWWAKDQNDRLITYHRGRRSVCILHPEFVQYKLDQVDAISKIGADGVFMDNVFMGALPEPIYRGDIPFTFAGDNHPLMQSEFKQRTGEKIPLNFEKNRDVVNEYLDFRVEVTTEFLNIVAKRAQKQGLFFGSNSLDPKFGQREIYGSNLSKVEEIQNYILFENHSLPNREGTKNNQYIQKMTEQISKPVFVVSYNKGIGKESEYSQDDIDLAFTESKYSDFNVCLKGSEYKTLGVWHNINPDHYEKPHDLVEMPLPKLAELSDNLEKIFVQFPVIKQIFKRHYGRLIRFYFESKVGRRLLDFIYYSGMR